MNGIVKWFDPKKGYGFITPSGNSKDIFIHHSNIIMDGYKTLSEGDNVSFEVADSEKGPKAVSVKKVS